MEPAALKSAPTLTTERAKEPTLNAEPAVQRRLLDLQELDLQLDQVAHKRKSLPEHKALAELATEKSVVDHDLVTADTEVSDLQREQKKADSDVDQVRQRKARNQQRLDSVSAPRRWSASAAWAAGWSSRRPT